MATNDRPAVAMLRAFRVTPGRLLAALLATEGLLFLGDWCRCSPFNEHKGYAVLIALASVGVFLLVMFAWFLASLFFRWRFQFSIRLLLVLMLAVALPCSWLSVEIRNAERQRVAAEEVRKHGGWGPGDSSAGDVTPGGLVMYDCAYDPTGRFLGDRSPIPPGPAWLRRMLGEQFFTHVIAASVSTDEGLEHLQAFPRLKSLELFNEIGGPSLEKLATLPTLQELHLKDAGVTDATFEHLRRVTQLQELDIERRGNFAGANVTDRGLAYLSSFAQTRTIGSC